MTTEHQPGFRPGSLAAREQGCTCPVIDNAHGAGRGSNGERFGWWIAGDCALHADATRAPEPER